MAGAISEIGSGMSVGANAQGIAVGPDNNIWLTELNIDKIAYITLAGVVTEFGGLTAGSGPNTSHPGPAGRSMWFAELNGDRIGRSRLLESSTEYSAGISPARCPAISCRQRRQSLVHGVRPGADRDEYYDRHDHRIHRAGITPGAVPAGITPTPRAICGSPEGVDGSVNSPSREWSPNLALASRRAEDPRCMDSGRTATSGSPETAPTDRPITPTGRYRIQYGNHPGANLGHHCRARRQHVVHRILRRQNRADHCAAGERNRRHVTEFGVGMTPRRSVVHRDRPR